MDMPDVWTADKDGSIQVWNSNSYDLVTTLRAHTEPITHLTIQGGMHEGGGKLYSASKDTTIAVYKV